jgi:hypothetical protein
MNARWEATVALAVAVRAGQENCFFRLRALPPAAICRLREVSEVYRRRQAIGCRLRQSRCSAAVRARKSIGRTLWNKIEARFVAPAFRFPRSFLSRHEPRAHKTPPKCRSNACCSQFDKSPTLCTAKTYARWRRKSLGQNPEKPRAPTGFVILSGRAHKQNALLIDTFLPDPVPLLCPFAGFTPIRILWSNCQFDEATRAQSLSP